MRNRNHERHESHEKTLSRVPHKHATWGKWIECFVSGLSRTHSLALRACMRWRVSPHKYAAWGKWIECFGALQLPLLCGVLLAPDVGEQVVQGRVV